MANDITTLAIEIQSQEAERNLRTFNELLSLSSQTANKMEKVSIEVDVQSALEQLQALKAGYDDLAASAQNVHFDTGAAPSASGTPAIDAEALNALKDFFTSSVEMSKAFREEMAQFNETIQKLEENSEKIASAGGKSTSSMRGAATVSKEYAAALKELLAAQKEMEKASAKADADMKATVAADEDAAAVKKKLIAAQRELKAVTDALNATHNGAGGDIIGLSQKEEQLKNRIAELKAAYEEARNAAEKFNSKLEDSAAKADVAAEKYKEVKAKVESMPKDPMGGVSESTTTFSEKAKLCGRTVTQMTRGISGIASMAGAAIPGVSGLGRAISMLGMGNPYLAAAAVAIAAITAAVQAYKNAQQDVLEATHASALLSGEIADSYKKTSEEHKSALDRLSELNSRENLYDSEKEESRKIVEKLTEAYKGLGIQYDAISWKVTNLAEVTEAMNKQQRESMLKRLRDQEEMAKDDLYAQINDAIGQESILKTTLAAVAAGLGTGGIGSAKIISEFYDVNQKIGGFIKEFNATDDFEKKREALYKIRQELHKFVQDHEILNQFFDIDEVSKSFDKNVQKALDDLEKISKARKELEGKSGVGGRSQEEINKSLAARNEKLQSALNASKTSDEKYADNVNAIQALIDKKQEFASLDEKSAVQYGGKTIEAREALLDIETEITNRTRERLAYEKQLEALTNKIEAQKRLWNMDEDGNIVSKKSDAEKRASRNNEIDDLQSQIRELNERYAMFAEYDPARGHQLQKEIAKAQLKLNTRQQERIADEERSKRDAELAENARKRLAEARKAYVIDADGNLIRKKNSDELSVELAAEVAEAKKRVDAARQHAANQAANEQAANSAEAELASLRKQQAELSRQIMERQQSLPEGDIESDEQLEKMGNSLDDLEAKIEEAKRRAVEARKKAGETGAASDLANAEAELTRVQARQLAEQEATDAAKRRAEEAKRGLVIDQNGNIIREQNEQELAVALQAEIDAQRDKVAKLTQGTKERYEAEAELTKLLHQQYDEQKRAQKATDTARRRADDAKKGFVWDSKENIVRRKNEAELQKEREAEIAAAEAKVAATKAGTKEQAEAVEELRKLKIADFNAREKKDGGDGSLGMMKEEQKVNSNMVKGVDAKSTEALQLQARNFTRGADPEKKVETSLKEIEKINREIRDFVQLCRDYLNDIQVASNDISSKVMTL